MHTLICHTIQYATGLALGCSTLHSRCSAGRLREARAHAVVRVLGVKVAAAVADTSCLELIVLHLHSTGNELTAQVRARWRRSTVVVGSALAAVYAELTLICFAPLVTFARTAPAVGDEATGMWHDATEKRLLDATWVHQATVEILDSVVRRSHPVIASLKSIGAVRQRWAFFLLFLFMAVRVVDALFQLVVPERRGILALAALNSLGRLHWVFVVTRPGPWAAV